MKKYPLQVQVVGEYEYLVYTNIALNWILVSYTKLIWWISTNNFFELLFNKGVGMMDEININN